MLTGLRIGIGFGWTPLVAAQMLVAAGLGHTILNASAFLMTDMVLMGSVIIGLVSLFSDLLMRHLDHKLVPWKGKM
jgi:taurine transport system permease protein